MKADKPSRIWLSTADVGLDEKESVIKSLSSGWISTMGPDVTAFECEVATLVGRKFAVALSSGTSALHLAFKSVEISDGDQVVIPTLTFGATVFPATYLGAKPIFLDIDRTTLTLDANLLSDFFRKCSKTNSIPKAIVPVDLYGVPCNYGDLLKLSCEYDIPLVCDSAESVGSTYQGSMLGSIGACSVFSFNGNKIITTSGGGMVLTNDEEVAEKVRFWAMQSREKVTWYEHREVGYNYRLSNILAALGRAQLRRLPDFVAKRRAIRSWYTELLTDIEGTQILQDPPWGESNSWLSVIFFDIDIYPNAPFRIREALERENIESRPIWKPMHQQPVFAGFESFLNGTSDKIFERGLCLPSSASLTQEDVARICQVLVSELKSIRIKVK